MSTNTVRDGSGAMFDGIAKHYDLVNRVISLGIDQSWRRQTSRALRIERTQRARILDLATGTGDLAVLLAEDHPAATLVGVDPSAKMLDVGRDKIARIGLSGRIEMIQGEAEKLPLEDASFDGVTIAFGIRNVADRLQGLKEMGRVTKPGGRVAILELSEPEGKVLGALARFHIHQVVPTIGGLVSGSKEYRYLQDSIAKFPAPTKFAGLIAEAGMRVLQVTPLTFGVAHLFVAEVSGS